MKVLITGGSGKLGRALLEIFPKALHPSSKELDVTNKEIVEAYIEKQKPDLIVHTAAYTSVAGAEKEKEQCWKINVSGTENLVEAVNKIIPDSTFVYVSTACVFHGDKGNYSEYDVPNPKNFYALTKLIGEFISRQIDNHLIVRTNFVAKEPWPHEKAFIDRFGTYLYAEDVSNALKSILDNGAKGLFHITGSEKMSMFELAKKTSPNVLEMTMKETDLPLTVDMSLISKKIKPFSISLDEQ